MLESVGEREHEHQISQAALRYLHVRDLPARRDGRCHRDAFVLGVEGWVVSLLVFLLEVAGVVALLYLADHLIGIAAAYRREAKMRRYIDEFRRDCRD